VDRSIWADVGKDNISQKQKIRLNFIKDRLKSNT